MTVHDAILVYFAVAFGIPSGLVLGFALFGLFTVLDEKVRELE